MFKLVFSGLLLLIIVFFVYSYVVKSSSKSFNSVKWKALTQQETQDLAARAVMLGDLMDNHLKKGMPKAKVYDLLGKPDFTKGTWDYYALGRSSYGIDEEFLKLNFSQEELQEFFLARG